MTIETIGLDVQSEGNKTASSLQNAVGNFATEINGFSVERHEKQGLPGRIPV